MEVSVSFRNSVTCEREDFERVSGMCKIKSDNLGFADRDKACALMGASILAGVLSYVERGDKPETVYSRVQAHIDEWLEEQYAG